MNKIMIAAAACALTGAVFADCAPDPIDPAARVYDERPVVEVVDDVTLALRLPLSRRLVSMT